MGMVELLHETAFPRIGDDPYFLTLGPNDFFWFRIETGPASS
jgi:maltose alpha-D-glucosyltransferase/alpha-amylase